MTTISNKAMLVSLKISQWAGRKHDRQATNTVETAYSTKGKVGQYSKKLLPGAMELAEIQRQAQDIRMFFYEQTLPWLSDGTRILSSKNYMEFTNAFRQRKASFDTIVEEFIDQYPTLLIEAKEKLGTLFKETDYPSPKKLRECFDCEIGFMPIPDVTDFRVTLSDEEKDTFLKRMQEVEQTAMRDCWSRLHDVVAKAAGKLQSPDAIFRDSLIENISEICKLLPKLNVTDDTNLEKMRQDVESLVAGISTDACRDNPEMRTYAAKRLDDITSKMSAFMS